MVLIEAGAAHFVKDGGLARTPARVLDWGLLSFLRSLYAVHRRRLVETFRALDEACNTLVRLANMQSPKEFVVAYWIYSKQHIDRLRLTLSNGGKDEGI